MKQQFSFIKVLVNNEKKCVLKNSIFRLKKFKMVKKIKHKIKRQETESSDVRVNLDQIGLSKNDEFTNQMENDSNMLIINGNKSLKADKNEANNEPKKRQLSKKERKRLEKVLERKNKSSKRQELLEKLASIQVNSNELKLYSSVKDIGQKEKRKFIDKSDESETRTINSISGSNKRKKIENYNEESASTDTDDVTSDSDIDEDQLQKALEQFKKKQEIERVKIAESNLEKFKPNKIVDSEDEEFHKHENESQSKNKRNTKYVHVERRDEIKESRSKLPIISEEQIIMEKIYNNDIIIISGETGSGKTTQVPQFLYEAGYAE